MTDFDLHIHSKHSIGVSPDMEIPVISSEAERKGLDMVGTGDILNPEWRKHVENTLKDTETGFKYQDVKFVLTVEVEDKDRIHHLIIFPDFETVENVYKSFEQFSSDIDSEGRPRLSLDGEEIAEIAKENGCLIGPCHAFTPYTGIYGKKDSLKQCYGDQKSKLDFLELGLSADSEMASKISDHDDLVFLSNSDAHSPWPHRLGREFNRAELTEENFNGLNKLFNREQGKVTLNVGLNPKEGKYHCSACNSCHQKYTLKQAEEFSWRCQECSGKIKKGVKDRVKELKDKEPEYEAKYLKAPPLSKIIQYTVGHASPTTKTVQEKYDELTRGLGAEVDILIDKHIDRIAEFDSDVAKSIRKFREGNIVMVPGGGGSYGERIIPDDREHIEQVKERRSSEIQCRYEN
ncbi:MAG: hypothetical protein J07AB43_15160 [Candidatus Nanosalina sp. J07AB43]|nr:MAG: hypothetical protein J07AB43_15160 [Candidatus Nanosalina sp. J07AB43]